MALRVRSHLQKPVVRTGVFWEQTALLAPPTTDTEVIIDRSTGIADVSARQRRHTLLDLRHAALSADNPRATTQPNLVDRLGRSIERGRSFDGPTLQEAYDRWVASGRAAEVDAHKQAYLGYIQALL